MSSALKIDTSHLSLLYCTTAHTSKIHSGAIVWTVSKSARCRTNILCPWLQEETEEAEARSGGVCYQARYFLSNLKQPELFLLNGVLKGRPWSQIKFHVPWKYSEEASDQHFDVFFQPNLDCEVKKWKPSYESGIITCRRRSCCFPLVSEKNLNDQRVFMVFWERAIFQQHCKQEFSFSVCVCSCKISAQPFSNTSLPTSLRDQVRC